MKDELERTFNNNDDLRQQVELERSKKINTTFDTEDDLERTFNNNDDRRQQDKSNARKINTTFDAEDDLERTFNNNDDRRQQDEVERSKKSIRPSTLKKISSALSTITTTVDNKTTSSAQK